MSTSTPSKTVGTVLLALQEQTSAPRVVISSAQDVSTAWAATVWIHFGRIVATALTAGVRFRIEGSSKASGDGHWYPLAEFQTAIATAEQEAVTSTNAAGQNVVTVASTTNLVAGDVIYLDHSTTANSEWHRIKSIVANTSITLEDNLVNAHNNPDSTINDQAEMFVAQLDLRAVSRLRLVCDGSGAGQNFAVESHMTVMDNITTAA